MIHEKGLGRMKKRIESLEALRCIAFLCIFVSHLGYNSISIIGPFGVCVFFILSGFVMTYSSLGNDKIKDVGIVENFKFAVCKIKRLYPLHIATMLLVLPIIFWDNYLYPQHLFYIKTVIKMFIHVMLLHSWVPTEGVHFAFNGASWYLSVILFLYFMFPWIFKKVRKHTGNKSALVQVAALILIQFLVFVALPAILLPKGANYSKLRTWFSYINPISRLFDFMIGCNLGYVFFNRKSGYEKKKSMCYTLLELCVLGSIVFAFAISGSNLVKMLGAKYVSIWTISASLLVYLYAVNRGHISSISVNRFTLYIAELSSYTFLIHQVVIRYFHIFTSNAKEQGYITHLVVPLLAFLITILLANCWRTFEKRKQR